MKKLLVILILGLLVISNYSIAQSFISETKLWSNVNYGNEYGSDYKSTYVKFLGDTVISEVQYKKVYRSTDSLMQYWEFAGGLRETDTGSVYYLEKSKEIEHLLLDFGTEDGDSIKLDTDYLPYMHIDSIRYKQFGLYKESRKHFYVRNGYAQATWIEGVGCTNGVLFDPRELMMIGETNNLVCFYENDSLKFHSDYYPSCFLTGKYTSIESLNENNRVRIINHLEYISFDFTSLKIHRHEVRIYDSSGRIVGIYESDDPQKIEIQKNDFRSGLYIYTIDSAKIPISGKFIIE